MSILRSGRNDDVLPGDHGDEMTPFDRLDDSAMDVLASGRVPPGRDDLIDVAQFAAELVDAAVATPPPSAELAALLAEGLSPAESDAVASSSSASRKPKKRKRTVLDTALAKLASLGFAAKSSVAVAALLAATTSAGAAGALPDSMQKTAADVVSAVSPFEISRPDDAAAPADAGAPDEVNIPTEGDPEANDHGQAVSDTARTTEAEGCERGHEVAEAAGGDPAECVDSRSVAPAEAPADRRSDTAAEDAADEAQQHAADEAQEHLDAAAGASQRGQDNADETSIDAKQQDRQADDAAQRGSDAAEAGSGDAADSRP